MQVARLILLVLSIAGAPGAPAAPAASPAASLQEHDKGWWRAVAADDFAPPETASLPPLLEELSGYLASPDPELRDEIAYGTLTQWLYVKRIVPPEARKDLIEAWCENLKDGIGEQGSDSVFRRWFSALMLSVVAALDNEAPFLDGAEFDRLLAAALAYLADERDVRGFDAEKGWIHSVAHTADLLKFLGRSRHLDPPGQSAILDGIADKLDATDDVLAHGEDERLARAVLSIVARADADTEAFTAFLERLRPPATERLPTPAELAVHQNRKHLAVSLCAVIHTDPSRPSPTE